MISKWFNTKTNAVQCVLCPNNCVLHQNQIGICGGKKNINEELVAINYGKICSFAIDPIEKKPLYHFYPGKNIFSVGVNGCNFKCQFCQNWRISQREANSTFLSPIELIEKSIRHNSVGIAFTYTEPFIWWEYIYDVAQIARQKKQKIVLVSNGYINEEPLREILPFIDAINVDLKAFSEKFYEEYCLGNLETVKRNIRTIAKSDCHIEVTTLLINSLNDSEKEIMDLVDFIFEIDRNIPLHFSKYFPNYKFNRSETEETTLLKAKEIADKKLAYVYLGNVQIRDGANTYCQECGYEVVLRKLYSIERKYNARNICQNCGFELKRFIGDNDEN